MTVKPRVRYDMSSYEAHCVRWIEKYRPVTLDDVSGHQDILATINKFVDSNKLPHLLLYGPPGTGKTSTILALAKRIYGAANARQMVLELNASDDRGIDVVREQIKTFASTKRSSPWALARPIQSLVSSSCTGRGGRHDQHSADGSARIMEKYTANTRFCIIANYAHKLSPALLSRCTRFRFSPLKRATSACWLIRLSRKRTCRLVLTTKQARRYDQRMRQDPRERVKREMITTQTIYTALPHRTPNRSRQSCRRFSTHLTSQAAEHDQHAQVSQGLALADIITALADELSKLEVSPEVMITWLDGLADIEHRVAGGGSETIQTGAVVGVVLFVSDDSCMSNRRYSRSSHYNTVPSAERR
ncbi:hypothetical protein GIB67_000066 [Kingdonia uniflora]|uniref:AAA+ ATPase domain-containing protein n=1 Tax=Kingdonia uniflora TaxID=39325 RepID=A0A7J7NVF0_9MAGN|nr:hypothetical protein GIB67_000066 [Kingdonia uniflora]